MIMSVTYDTAVAAEHTLSELMVQALLSRVDGAEPNHHGNTFLALQGRGLVTIDAGWNISVTDAGRQVARKLRSEQAAEPTPALAEQTELDVPVGPASPEALAELQDDARRHTRLTPEQQDRAAARDLDGLEDALASQNNATGEMDREGRLSATPWFVVLTVAPGTRAPLAVVVGSREDAQDVADRWNLAHLDQIAEIPDSHYAVVTTGTGTEVWVHSWTLA